MHVIRIDGNVFAIQSSATSSYCKSVSISLNHSNIHDDLGNKSIVRALSFQALSLTNGWKWQIDTFY